MFFSRKFKLPILFGQFFLTISPQKIVSQKTSTSFLSLNEFLAEGNWLQTYPCGDISVFPAQ